MMSLKKLTRPVLVLAATVLAAFAFAACGSEEESLHAVEGEPITLGELEYNVIFTRPLNIDDVEDRDYLTGQEPPPSGSMYIGVFVQVENLSDNDSQSIADGIHVTDTEEDKFEPLSSESLYALHMGASVGPGDVVPAMDSTPEVGPIEGSVLIFEIPDEATENRPLELIIPGPDGDARVELDI